MLEKLQFERIADIQETLESVEIPAKLSEKDVSDSFEKYQEMKYNEPEKRKFVKLEYPGAFKKRNGYWEGYVRAENDFIRL